MPISIAAALVLAAQCAPTIAPETLLSIIQVESRFNPLAIGVNGRLRVSIVASDRADAVARANAQIAAGRSVDLGLAQINSRNLSWLGLTVEQAFEPCANLTAAARVLAEGYTRSNASRIGAQAAIRTALSYYNTGHPQRGFHNGYVAKVMRAAEHLAPSLLAGPKPSRSAAVAEPPVTPPVWDVFGRAQVARAGFVLSPELRAVGAAQ